MSSHVCYQSDIVLWSVAYLEQREHNCLFYLQASQQRAEEDLDELNQHLLSSRQEAMGIESKLQATERAKYVMGCLISSGYGQFNKYLKRTGITLVLLLSFLRFFDCVL